jgi:hypothetical protein
MLVLLLAIGCGSTDSQDDGSAEAVGQEAPGDGASLESNAHAGTEDPAQEPDSTNVIQMGPSGLVDEPGQPGDTGPGQRGSTHGFSHQGEAQPELVGPILSPSGRLITPGTADDLGYVLPLDILRKRPERLAPAPTRSEIERRRAEAAPSGFEEHRLGPDDGHTQNETTIDVEGDVLVAGWNNYTDNTLLMGVARSTDGGHSWISDLLGDHDVTSDPAVKAGGNATWYYAYLARGGVGGNDFDIFVRRSTDDGATWQNPVDASQNGSFDDKPYIDASGAEVLVGWADFAFSPAKVRVVRSTDGGISFGSNHVLANNSVGGNGACPVIGPGGTYYMFWRDSFQDSLWISRSTDTGATWTPDRGIVDMNPLPSSLPPGFRIVNLPSADADPLTGELLVVWNDQRFGDPDILAIRSTDFGETWSAPVRVNDDAGTEPQFFPWVSFDGNGVAHVVWYDRRENGEGIDVYYARSLDGGASFEENIRVTAAAFTPVLPWDTGIDFIGDYNGIAATEAQAYPFYQDSREGNQDVYVAILPGSTTGIDSDDLPPQPRTRQAVSLSVSPSPFRSSTRLTVSTAPPGRAGIDGVKGTGAGESTDASRRASTVEIVSAGGRVLRQLPLGPEGWADWDGRDSNGRELPSGVYYARPGGDTRVAARLVKVR